MTSVSLLKDTESEVKQEICSISSNIPVFEVLKGENLYGAIGTMGADVGTEVSKPPDDGNELLDELDDGEDQLVRDEDEGQLNKVGDKLSEHGDHLHEDGDQLDEDEDEDQLDEDEDQLDEDEDRLDEDDGQLNEYDDQMDDGEHHTVETELACSSVPEPIRTAFEEFRQNNAELPQLEIFFPERKSESNNNLEVSSPSRHGTNTTTMLYFKDHECFAEASQYIRLSSSLPLESTTEPSSTTHTTCSQPPSDVAAYRDIIPCAVSSSSPGPENTTLPPSSSPQWNEIPESDGEVPADLNDDAIMCNAEITISSSPEFGRGSQDGISSDLSYNDLTDSTLVEVPEDKAYVCVAPNSDVYTSSPPSVFNGSIEEVSEKQPEDSACAGTGPSPSPVLLPNMHTEESTAIPTGFISPSPQPSPNSERSEDTHPTSPMKGPNPSCDISTAKKRSYSNLEESYKAPIPKRMTPSLAKRQHAKLSTPFRSPLLNKTHLQNISDSRSTKRPSLQPFPLQTKEKHSRSPLPASSLKSSNLPTDSLLSSPACSQPGTSSRKNTLNATYKATAQFKLPLMSTHTAPSSSRVNLSRAVQSLEQKLQLLKRAVKIKRDEDEDKLVELVQKWKRAGREAAWDLWHIVREQQSDENTGVAYPGTNAKSVSNSDFSGSWGWASDMDNNRGTSAFGSSWGFEEPMEAKFEDDGEPDDFPSPRTFENEFRRAFKRNPNSVVLPTSRSPLHKLQLETYDDTTEHVDNIKEMEEDEERETVSESKTLGTMLRQFGIPHETLGWNEDEGDFIDD